MAFIILHRDCLLLFFITLASLLVVFLYRHTHTTRYLENICILWSQNSLYYILYTVVPEPLTQMYIDINYRYTYLFPKLYTYLYYLFMHIIHIFYNLFDFNISIFVVYTLCKTHNVYLYTYVYNYYNVLYFSGIPYNSMSINLNVYVFIHIFFPINYPKGRRTLTDLTCCMLYPSYKI